MIRRTEPRPQFSTGRHPLAVLDLQTTQHKDNELCFVIILAPIPALATSLSTNVAGVGGDGAQIQARTGCHLLEPCACRGPGAVDHKNPVHVVLTAVVCVGAKAVAAAQHTRFLGATTRTN